MRAAAVRRFLADRPLVICIVVLAAMALAGLGLVITGWITDSVHTAGNGGDWLFFAFFLALPGWIGWHLAKRQRKIAVEVKLDEVADDLDLALDGLGRVEELLSPKAAPLAVVREFPRR